MTGRVRSRGRRRGRRCRAARRGGRRRARRRRRCGRGRRRAAVVSEPAADPFERAVKDARIGLLDALLGRIDHEVDVRADADPVERGAHPAVGVRDDDELPSRRPQPLQRGDDVGGHVLPEVVRRVVALQVGERRRDRRRPDDAGPREDLLEDEPAADDVELTARRACRPRAWRAIRRPRALRRWS